MGFFLPLYWTRMGCVYIYINLKGDGAIVYWSAVAKQNQSYIGTLKTWWPAKLRSCPCYNLTPEMKYKIVLTIHTAQYVHRSRICQFGCKGLGWGHALNSPPVMNSTHCISQYKQINSFKTGIQAKHTSTKNKENLNTAIISIKKLPCYQS